MPSPQSHNSIISRSTEELTCSCAEIFLCQDILEDLPCEMNFLENLAVSNHTKGVRKARFATVDPTQVIDSETLQNFISRG